MKTDEVIAELLSLKGYESLRPPQEKAIEQGLLENNNNYIIIAPTSTGKTFTAELAIYRTLKSGGRVLYLVPSKALVTEKMNDFKYLNEKKHYLIADSTGEDAWDEAHVLITTVETFFFNTLKNPTLTRGFNLAIVDEFHLLYDRLRGFILEKSLILSKEFNLRLICLSATFEDKKEVAEWLGSALLVNIPEENRQIKLKEDVIPVYDVASTNRQKELYKCLIKLDNHPYLIFCNTKPNTASRARDMAEYVHKNKLRTNLGNEYKVENIRKEMEAILGRELTENEELLSQCLAYKVGFHNALLDMDIRTFVETRFNSGMIDWLFATTTLAVGFNSPTKSVVINDLRLGDDFLPVYMYIQMIGRAGRPQFCGDGEKIGYAYVVANSTANEMQIRSKYFGKQLENAYSHIAYDDYFRKAILELIYAERNRYTNIISFFENSFNTFQTKRNLFGTYNLIEKIKEHVTWLIGNKFIRDEGAAGYKLTPLGEVTVEFLMHSYVAYPLTAFQRIEEYIKEQGLAPTFDTVYMLIKTLNEATGFGLYKKQRESSPEVEQFFGRRGIIEVGNSEYTAYAIWYGWMENKTLKDIENTCKVYVDPIKSVADELIRALSLMENMFKASGRNVPIAFQYLRIRVKKGIGEKEVSVAKYPGYGREMTKDLYVTAVSIINAIKRPMPLAKDIPNSSLMEFYIDLLNTEGREEAKRYLISHSRLFREGRAESFIELVEKEIPVKAS
ncbi:superfamily II helicase [Candidatus Methanoperedens nitroreducens]|uniref:Superfamily II helicase n=1 Tax=Candidatus Methanoperedens nitratireducens TaxID=1392998 RepID=A0A062UW68_9EURY|nr:DEAD/DEAH box helicase [Candidatus Methanoperedens nitroreducens]KCZ71261.1 superfamily II helicase [Candidatus Methanoperedens nitroreducens]MDJ1420311.1 DEAD/DEAH box helicase family protein [Candidatus Methanoperedens sp.]